MKERTDVAIVTIAVSPEGFDRVIRLADRNDVVLVPFDNVLDTDAVMQVNEDPAASIGLMVGYLAMPYFGWLGQFGFDTLSWGVSNLPVVRGGMHFGAVHVTLELGAEISFGRWARLGL